MDFYFKYREYTRTLCSTFRHKGVVLNLYKVNMHSDPAYIVKYVLTKNRKVLSEALTENEIEDKFLNCISMETQFSPELFVSYGSPVLFYYEKNPEVSNPQN